VGFLRRLFAGEDAARDAASDAVPDAPPRGSSTDGPADPSQPDAGEPMALDGDERARELDLARFDQDRITDLVRRQQRYAERSWTPPPQGTDRRADDEDSRGA
jgi:hypothetical protein